SSTAPSTGDGNISTSLPSSPKKRPTPRKPSAAAAKSQAQPPVTGYNASHGFGAYDDEDDEDLPPPPASKRKRVEEKVEAVEHPHARDVGRAGGDRSVYQFKAEHVDGVDLEHD
ncbi:hypothetical protein IFR05_017509, partial [Cadophora sp. M221]